VHGPHHTLGKTGDAETAENLVVLHLRGRSLSANRLRAKKTSVSSRIVMPS
jgi:hypothetical protein